MKPTIGSATAMRWGPADFAVSITSSLHRRIDGCGSSPDRTDWIVACESQVAFRDLLHLYERGLETLPLPDPFGPAVARSMTIHGPGDGKRVGDRFSISLLERMARTVGQMSNRAWPNE